MFTLWPQKLKYRYIKINVENYNDEINYEF